MSEKKKCWNICCVCWENNSERLNCNADDLNPDLCCKSNIDFRTMLDKAQEMHALENKTLPFKKILQLLIDLKKNIEENWPRNEPVPGKEIINVIISTLENR